MRLPNGQPRGSRYAKTAWHGFPPIRTAPSELRLQIWEDAVCGEPGRVVEARKEVRDVVPGVANIHEYTSATKIPGLLHACHTS